MTEGPTSGLDAMIAELVRAEKQVTLESIGGIEAVPVIWANSPMFPLVAEAVVSEWGTLSDSQHEHSSELLAAAIAGTKSALALGDTCLAVVPSAVDLGIANRIKDALRTRAAERSTESQAALAATAIRWLAHLAVHTHIAKPALMDLLTSVATSSQEAEPPEFAIAAAQAAGLAHDFWKEQNAWECLERLTESAAEADAWFGLGQVELVNAFEADSKPALMAALDHSLSCFDNAKNTGEDRPDAKLYAHIIRFLRELSNEAPAEMLQEHADGADSALLEYMQIGRNLPEQPKWLRPRYTAENAWMLAVRRLHQAIEQSSDHPWYQPALVIGALSDAYLAANSLCLNRHDPASEETSDALTDLLVPALTTPFLEREENLALVERWLSESDSTDAQEFARLVREISDKHLERAGEEAADEHVVPPKHQPPGNTRRSQISSVQNPEG